jgi:recombination protein RecA
MARPKKTNEETIVTEFKASGNSFLDDLKKASGSQTAFVLSQDEFPIKNWISTGNYMLNALISADPYKGMPTGRSLQLAGEKGTGKTYIAISLMNEAEKIGYSGCLFDSEFANNDKRDMESKGVNVNNTLWLGVETIEDLKTQTLKILGKVTNQNVFMMVDSLGNLSTKKELNDSSSGGDKRDMTRPSALKSYFRTVTMQAGYKHVPIVVINHVYADTGSMFKQNIIAGGGGPAFGASITLVFSKSAVKETVNGVEIVTGALIKVLADKNRFAKEKSAIYFIIDFDKGIEPQSGLLEFCLAEKLIIPDSKLPKSGSTSKIKKFKMNGVEITRKEMTLAWWEEYLKNGLADILRNRFKYQSVADDLGIDEEEDEGEDDGI